MADPTATPLFGVPTAQPSAPMASSAPPQVYHEQSGKHKGIAGVARDVLGTLGDFLLTRLHMPAMYAPAQEQRKLAAAEQNIDSDPVGAIQQVTSINPVFGAKLRDQYIDNTRQQASLASTKEQREARLAQAQSLIDDRSRNTAAAYLNTLSGIAPEKRAEAYVHVRKNILASAGKNGTDLSSELPETYDEDGLTSWIGRSVPVATQWAQKMTQQKIDNQAVQATARDDTTRRGQDLSHEDRQSGQAITARGQDLRAASSANRPKKVTNVQTYVGEDGYHYAQRSDGSVVKSPTRVRAPVGRAQPTEGMRKVIGGVTYVWRDGKAQKE